MWFYRFIAQRSCESITDLNCPCLDTASVSFLVITKGDLDREETCECDNYMKSFREERRRIQWKWYKSSGRDTKKHSWKQEARKEQSVYRWIRESKKQRKEVWEFLGINLQCSTTLSLLLAQCRWRLLSVKWNKSSFNCWPSVTASHTMQWLSLDTYHCRSYKIPSLFLSFFVHVI